MPLTPNSVREKTFTVTRLRGGYQMSEVDAFLDEVVAELARLHAETGDLHAKLFRQPRDTSVIPPLPELPEPTEDDGDDAGHGDSPRDDSETATAAMRTLLMAQRTSDQAIAEARAEAANLVSTAKEHAQRLDAETRQRHQAIVADLDRRRRELEHSVEQLRVFEGEHRARLRTYLETQLRDFTAQNRVLRLPDNAPQQPASQRRGAQSPTADRGRDGGSAPDPAAATTVGSRVVVPAAAARTGPAQQADRPEGDGS